MSSPIDAIPVIFRTLSESAKAITRWSTESPGEALNKAFNAFASLVVDDTTHKFYLESTVHRYGEINESGRLNPIILV
jgi:hypothetical protein